MIIDCHAHYEPKILDETSLIERMDKHGIQKTALMSKMTTEPIYKKSNTLMGIQRLMLRNKTLRYIAKRLDSSFHKQSGEWNPWYRNFIGKKKSYDILNYPDNQSVFDVVSKYPDRLMGWIFLNPRNPDWEKEFFTWKDTPGSIGIKIHPFWHRYSLADINTIADLALKYEFPLLIHLGFDSMEVISKFIQENVELKVIFAHAGFPFYRDIWSLIKKSSTLYVDLSSHHVDRVILKNVISYLGPKKCIYGTDDPYGDDNAGIKIQKWINNLNLTTQEEESIFAKNFLDIIKQ